MMFTSPNPPLAVKVNPDPHLSAMWEEAIRQYRSGTGSQALDFERAISESDPDRSMLMLVKQCVGDFEKFREHDSKIRRILKPIAEVLMSFADAGSDVGSAALPGGTFVLVAISGLLKATKKVSELYDTIENVLEQIRDALDRFKIYLAPSVPISPTLAESLVRSLIVMLDLIAIVMKYCVNAAGSLRRIYLRAKDYFQQIMGDTEVQEKVLKLQQLTGVQSLQAAAETHANVRELQTIMKWMQTREEYHLFKEYIPLGTVDNLYAAFLQERQIGTCEWIKGENGFKEWREGGNRVYAILGPAGCGKTTFCTFIIEHLRKELHDQESGKDPNYTLAYFYFRETTNTDDQNDVAALMKSLLLQLVRASPDCWRHLRGILPKLGPPPLTPEQLFSTLREMLEIVQHLGPTYIVIDALDECYSKNPASSGSQGRMLDFLKKLSDLASQIRTLRLLVTSRPERRITLHLDTIQPAILPLRDLPNHQKDMEIYVDRKLSGSMFEQWTEEAREKAKAALSDMEKSQGMFLWVSLQVRLLEGCAPDELSDMLKSLPTGLNETYSRILTRFVRHHPSLPRVRFILGFIAFARRPLAVDDVLAALSFDFTAMKVKSSNDSSTATEADLFRVLPGLIDIKASGSKRTVQFIHFSVKEYLTDPDLRRNEKIGGYYLDRDLADIFIATLSLAALEPKNGDSLGSLREYAAEHWHEHVPSDVRDGSVEANTSDTTNNEERRKPAECLNGALIAFLNPESLAFKSWKKSRDWNDAATPLHCVVRLGLPDLVMRLVGGGADCNAFADGQTPLYDAVNSGADTCTDALLKGEVNPNLTQIDGYTPLHLAASLGHATIVSALLDAGADTRARSTLNIHGPIGNTALHSAIHHRHTSICEILLNTEKSSEIGDIPNWWGQTPLHYAAQGDEPSIVQMLLAHGANARTTDVFGNTALSLAREDEASSCIELSEEDLEETTRVSESSPEISIPRDTLNRLPDTNTTSYLTLHAFLKPSTPISAVATPKYPLSMEYSVYITWSSNPHSVANGCMLSLLYSPTDDGESDSVHCIAKLYSINADGSFYPLLVPERRSFSLSFETQASCRETVATISSLKGSQQTTTEPRLLVHSIPAGEASSHNPMSFAIPSGLTASMTLYERDNVFILQQLATAAWHFQSCRQVVAVERTPDSPDGRVAVPPTFSNTIMVTCGVVVMAALVYMAVLIGATGWAVSKICPL